MLYKIHYLLIISGWCASSVLLGVFVYAYTDASPMEMGYLFMAMPFISILSRPMISSAADRKAAHKTYLLRCLLIVAACHLPFVIIPFLGPEIYETHARICWYIIVILKTIGDIAMNGSVSLGDALAINYARRLGEEFMVYRVWGTTAWMSFGLLIGQINEVQFLPKYTPGFIILISAFLIDALLIWLWPEEFFRMVPVDQAKDKQQQLNCLMPREAILAHVRDKLGETFSALLRRSSNGVVGGVRKRSETSEIIKASSKRNLDDDDGKQMIDKGTQFRILLLLFKRDLRIFPYLMFLACMGIMVTPLNFFLVGLADRCQEGECDFSQLSGLLQVSMAGAETILFMFARPIKLRLGRLSLCAMSALLASIEFMIYTEYWYTMNPYFVVLTNALRGLYFGNAVILMTEVASMFSNEVQFLIPELKSRGLINNSTSSEFSDERLKLSLAATMQAVTSAAVDGLGRGLGALICGLMIGEYSYRALWLLMSGLNIAITIICLLVKIFDATFRPNFGLEPRAERKQVAKEVA